MPKALSALADVGLRRVQSTDAGTMCRPAPIAGAAIGADDRSTQNPGWESHMNLMSVDLYQSATDPEKFLAVPAGVDPADLLGPMTFDKAYPQVVRYNEAFELHPAKS